MALEVIGKVVSVLDAVEGSSAKGAWKKREFVIETAEQFPKTICLVAWGDSVDTVSSLKSGDSVKCGIDISSREHNGRWYTEAKAWKIDKQEGAMQQESIPSGAKSDDDELPF